MPYITHTVSPSPSRTPPLELPRTYTNGKQDTENRSHLSQYFRVISQVEVL